MAHKARFIGRILKQYRETRFPKLTQAQIANRLGLKNRQAIAQKESGKHPIFEEELYEWLEMLDLDVVTLSVMVRDEMKKSAPHPPLKQ